MSEETRKKTEWSAQQNEGLATEPCSENGTIELSAQVGGMA